jgi:hypothetical protein
MILGRSRSFAQVVVQSFPANFSTAPDVLCD